MKKMLYLAVLFFSDFGFSQSHCFIEPNVNLTTNDEKREAYECWVNYLGSKPDSLYDNPYWNAADKVKYKSYDLLKSEGFLSPGLYGLFDKGLNNLVLSITRNGDCYDIRSLFYWPGKDTKLRPLAITHVIAKKENGEMKLYNWLAYHTKNWLVRDVGNITYIYHPLHAFDAYKAAKANQLMTTLSRLFDISAGHVEYYIAPNCDEIYRLKGFDYVVGMGNAENGICGYYDCFNQIIYSNSIKGEYYEHEIVHLINNRFPHAHGLFLNGLADYFIEDNVKMGLPITEHFKRMDTFLKNHPQIDLNRLDSFYQMDNVTTPSYFLGIMLCHFSLEKGGIALLRKGLSAGTDDADLYDFMETELGIPKNKINTVFRKQISRFAENGFIPFSF